MEERGPQLQGSRRVHRGLVAAARAAGWTKPNRTRSLARTAAHLGVFVSLESTARLAGGGWWRLVFLPAQIFVVAGFYRAMHEATHRNRFRARWANRTAAVFWASMLGANGAWYREMHFFHHAWTRTEGGKTAPNYAGLWSLVRDVPGTGFEFIGLTVRGRIGPIFGRYPKYAATVRRDQLRRESVINVLVWDLEAWAVVRFPAVRTGWLAPLVGFYVVGYAFVAWPEHYGLGYRADPLQSARTIKMPIPMRFVYWDNNFHAAHHLCPTVTWNNLEAFTATLPWHQRTTIGLFHVILVRQILAGDRPGVPGHDPVPDDVPVFWGPFERPQSAALAPI